MAVLGRLLIASAERLDLPDLLSVDSFTAGDFKFLLKALMGDETPYVLKGFDVINPQDAIGSQSVSVRVADSVVFYPGSNAGPFFHGLEEGNPNSQPLVPELRKNATNYVYATLTTFDTARDTRAFWDPDLDGGEGGEFTQDINTESVLGVSINVSTSSFPANTIPIAIIEVGAAVIESIEDARENMFRLGKGGINPDPFARFQFKDLPSADYARKEPPTTMSSALDPNPFQGADKNINSLKEWMDVVMTKLAELGGTTFWYEDASTFSLVNLFLDSSGTSFTSKGDWDHDSATPGLITWTEDIKFKNIPDPREVIIRQGNKTLANDEVLYVQLVREEPINTGNVEVEWFNGLNFVNGVVGAFQNLTKGDWVKKASDDNELYLRVEEFYASDSLTGGVTSPALARSIKLSSTYAGVNETERGVYSKGVYTSAEVSVAARGSQDLADAGGNLAWLANRQDTIQNVSDITTTTLSAVDITEADGTTAKITSTGHGLQDKDRVTITDSVVGYNGTYQVEVEDADIFYITTSQTGDELGVANAYYAVVTTASRSTSDGLELESENHNFDTNDTVVISDTSNYDGSYEINVRSNTTFQIAVGSGLANEAAGTATLPRVNVRSEFGIVTLVQGEITGIAQDDASTIRSFIGMTSTSETHPTYNIPPSYNTLDGQQNYNGETDDNLTVRVSKLTAMMADKVQDKTITFASSGYESISNTTSGTARNLSFNATATGTPRIDVVLPSSATNGSIGLTGTVGLEENEAAYVQIDRNAAFSVANLAALTVAPIESVPLEENTFIVALRLTGNDLWLWDGTNLPQGETQTTTQLDRISQQDRNLKLVRGGTWSWDLGTNTLSWSADAYIHIPDMAEDRNRIPAGSIVLPTDLDIAVVELNRQGAIASDLTVNQDTVTTWNTTSDSLIIARRIGDDVIVGTGTERLLDGQSMQLDQTTSDQTLGYIGATDTADSTPDYLNAIVTAETEVTTLTFPAASALTSGQRFNINSASDLEEYYVYVLIDGAGTPPTVAGKTGIQVDLLSSDTNLQVAAKMHAAINAIDDFNSVDNTDGTITVTNAEVGATTDAANVDMGVGFSVSIDTNGAGAANYVVQDDEALVQAIKRLDQEQAQIAAEIAEDTWKAPVADFASLPASGNQEADARIAIDTGLIWRWDSSENQWLPAGDTSSGLKIIGGGTTSVGLASEIIYDAPQANQDQFFGPSDQYRMGQRFIPADDSELLSATFYLAQSSFSGSGTIKLELYSTSGNNPDTLLATATNTVDPTGLPAHPSPNGYTFNFNNYQLTGGTAYALVVNLEDVTFGGGSIGVYHNTGNPISTAGVGRVFSSNGGTTWGFDTDDLIGTIKVQTSNLSVDFTDDLFLEKSGLSYEDNTILRPTSETTKALDTSGLTGDPHGAQIPYNATYFGQTNNISAFTWVQIDNNTPEVPNSNIFSHGSSLASGIKWFLQEQDGTLRVLVSNDGSTGVWKNYQTAAEIFSDNKWHHVGFTFSSNTLKVYVDGQEITGGDLVINNDDTVNTLFLSTDAIAINHATTNSFERSIDGRTDNASYWDKELSAAEVTEMYNGGKLLDLTTHSASANLQAFYTYEDGAVTDLSGNGQNGSLVGNGSIVDASLPGSQSAIVFSADRQVAYVEPNLTAGGDNLVVNVDTLDNVPVTGVVLARRDGSDVIVGSSSTRLTLGESAKLYDTITDQVRDKRYGHKSAFFRSDNPVTWTGTELIFSTDIILDTLKNDGTEQAYTVSSGDSPIALANGQYAYAVIDRTQNNQAISLTVGSAPAESSPGSEVIIFGKRQDALGVGYLHLPFNKQVLEPGQTVRLGASGAGGGEGNTILETIKNRLLDSPFEAVTPQIFRQDTDTLLDGSSTGSYSLVTKNFEFTAGSQTMITVQQLDADFLSSGEFLNEVELLSFWDLDNIDTGATYDVSRNGGTEWQTITMERVDSTDMYRGIHTFDEEATNQSVDSQATTDGTTELNDTTQKYLTTALTISNTTELRQLDIDMTVNGSPTGNMYVAIYSDNAGDPDEVLAETNAIDISTLITGTNSINIPDIVLTAGTYHIVIRTDANYDASFSTGVTSVALDSNSAGTSGRTSSDGSSWSAGGFDLVYDAQGIEYDLRIRITSSVASNLEGTAVYYDKSTGGIATGVIEREVVHFKAVADNFNEFTLTSFVPNSDLLNVYYIQAGQVFHYPAFVLSGQKVIFETDQFNNNGVEADVTLVFDQTRGGAFDNSDLNGLLLSDNALGSTDPSIDKSAAGRGILQRADNGQLIEISWHWNGSSYEPIVSEVN